MLAAKGCGLPDLESHPAGLGPVCGRHDADARQYYPRGGVGRAEPVLSYEVKVSMKTRDPTIRQVDGVVAAGGRRATSLGH